FFVPRDFGLAVGEVRGRVDRVVGLERVQGPVGRVGDHVAERVVRLARVEIVDVAGGGISQRAAGLALGNFGLGRGGGASAATAVVVIAAAACGNEKRERRHD